MKASFVLAVLALVLAATTVHTNLILSSKGKKHKDLIVLGKKCEPTIIKSSGKKGKYGQTLVMNNNEHDCHETKDKYIPIPMMYQDYYHQPKHQIIHESHHYFPMEPLYSMPYYDDKSMGYAGQGMSGGYGGGTGTGGGHGKFGGFGNIFDGLWA